MSGKNASNLAAQLIWLRSERDRLRAALQKFANLRARAALQQEGEE